MTQQYELNVTMLVAIVCQLIVATTASPYHKYPFVFLLDVGNDELVKTNTEQIRLTLPGGSLAVRYPAISDGDVITHVRVTSIDFGSDLKASILDGGPGYKFVVLVFLGNPGVTSDAVITLQTLPNQGSSGESSVASWSVNTMSGSDEVPKSEINNGIEDMSNEIETPRSKNADLALQSSNVNNYAQFSKGDDDDDVENDDSGEIKDELDDDVDKGQSIQEQDSIEVSNEKSDDKGQNSNESDQSDEDDDHAERVQGYESIYSNEFKSINDKSLDQDARMYIQDSIYDRQGHNSGEDSVELDQTFNDEEIHNDFDKYKDSNNNSFDSDYESAVA